jgi:hypothetical protein
MPLDTCVHIPACSPVPMAVIFSIMFADMFAVSVVFVGIEFVPGSEELCHKCEVGVELGEVERFGGLKYSGDQDRSYRHALKVGICGCVHQSSPPTANFCSSLPFARATYDAVGRRHCRRGIWRSIWVGTMIVGPWLHRYVSQ